MCAGCTTDAECQPEYAQCNVTVGQCVGGSRCGSAVDCRSGFCSPSLRTCTTGMPPVCSVPGDCVSRVCDPVYGCVDGNAGSRCTVPSACKSGFCARPTSAGLCHAGLAGGLCGYDEDCASHMCADGVSVGCANASQCPRTAPYCNSRTTGANGRTCTTGLVGVECGAPADCMTGFCDSSTGGPTSGVCTTGAQGAGCGASADCTEGLICSVGLRACVLQC